MTKRQWVLTLMAAGLIASAAFLWGVQAIMLGKQRAVKVGMIAAPVKVAPPPLPVTPEQLDRQQIIEPTEEQLQELNKEARRRWGSCEAYGVNCPATE